MQCHDVHANSVGISVHVQLAASSGNFCHMPTSASRAHPVSRPLDTVGRHKPLGTTSMTRPATHRRKRILITLGVLVATASYNPARGQEELGQLSVNPYAPN